MFTSICSEETLRRISMESSRVRNNMNFIVPHIRDMRKKIDAGYLPAKDANKLRNNVAYYLGLLKQHQRSILMAAEQSQCNHRPVKKGSGYQCSVCNLYFSSITVRLFNVSE